MINSKQPGYTLIEIIIVLAISSLMLVTAGRLYTTTRSHNAVNNGTNALKNAIREAKSRALASESSGCPATLNPCEIFGIRLIFSEANAAARLEYTLQHLYKTPDSLGQNDLVEAQPEVRPLPNALRISDLTVGATSPTKFEVVFLSPFGQAYINSFTTAIDDSAAYTAENVTATNAEIALNVQGAAVPGYNGYVTIDAVNNNVDVKFE